MTNNITHAGVAYKLIDTVQIREGESIEAALKRGIAEGIVIPQKD